MSVYLKIDMNVGLDGPLAFDPDTLVKSCVFFWKEYNPNYPYNKHGHREGPHQLEFVDIPVRDINWVLTELYKLEEDN
jgi:hypothetical protein